RGIRTGSEAVERRLFRVEDPENGIDLRDREQVANSGGRAIELERAAGRHHGLVSIHDLCETERVDVLDVDEVEQNLAPALTGQLSNSAQHTSRIVRERD